MESAAILMPPSTGVSGKLGLKRSYITPFFNVNRRVSRLRLLIYFIEYHEFSVNV